MGRTVPTYGQSVKAEIQALSKFRLALLRGEDREAFDRVCEYALMHRQAGSLATRSLPFETMLLCMCLELQKELARVRKRLKVLESWEEKECEECLAVAGLDRVIEEAIGNECS